MNPPQSWHATGLVEKAWERIEPATRDELAKRMGVAGADLSGRNTSTAEKPRARQRRMTVEFAERIVAAVRQDDPTFSLADLGAPTSVVVEADPTVLDRLQELAEKLAVTETALTSLKGRHDRLQRRVRTLELARREPGATATTGQPG